MATMYQNAGPLKKIDEPGVPADGQLLHSLRAEVAALLKRKQPSFPGAQPVSFARRHLEDLLQKECAPLTRAQRHTRRVEWVRY